MDKLKAFLVCLSGRSLALLIRALQQGSIAMILKSDAFLLTFVKNFAQNLIFGVKEGLVRLLCVGWF